MECVNEQPGVTSGRQQAVRSLSVLMTVLAVVVALLVSTSAKALPENFQLETVLTGLNQPVYLSPLPDGRMLVGAKTGRISIFDPRDLTPSGSVYLDLTNIDTSGERGLTSMALDPAFQSNGYLYLYYTHGTSGQNRISRFTHGVDSADPASEVVIWQNSEVVTDCCHYGGGLGFGPDGRLYLTTGEEFDGPQAQDLTRAGGKILRINADGSIPADNPFADGPGGNLDEIWALGLRNPYRSHWDLYEGRLYIGEVGGNVRQSREDIHVGRAGANYGWPECEGQCDDPAHDDPIHDYGHSYPSGRGGAVTLGTVYRGNQFPSGYLGALFFTDYVQGWIRYLTFDGDGSVVSVNDFADETDAIGPAVHLIEYQDGSLFLADISGSVKRITFNAGNQPPIISSVSVDDSPGGAPVNVTFSVAATDPESDDLNYTWLTGDGAELTGQTVSHQYTANGVYPVQVRVTDGFLTTSSEVVEVQVGNAPTAVISSPAQDRIFRAGDLIAFDGSASSDPDESLPQSAYSWDVRFGHNTHTHPALTDYVGSSGVLEINTTGHDYHSDTRYEFELTVTDSDGLSSIDTVTIYPDKVDVNLSTSPEGLGVLLDGVQLATPIAYDSLIGFRHLVSVPANVCMDGTRYQFSGWSDGGGITHEIVVPESDLDLTAQYAALGPCAALPGGGLVLHLESSSGVSATDSGLVQSWVDQSGQGNNLTASGGPQLIPAALNGQPVVDFDGSDDYLDRLGGLTGLPEGNGDRTLFLVANYQGGGFGGFGYGRNRCNQMFGTSVNPAGDLMVQGWCDTYDFHTPFAGTGEGWLVQSARLQTGQMSHYRNGQLIDTQSHVFDTVAARLTLGAELDRNPRVDMQVAAALIYDRALSDAEMWQVTSYLSQRYLPASGQPPLAADDVATVSIGGTVDIDVLINDTDLDGGGLDPASLLIVDEPADGVLSIDPSSGVVTYSHLGVLETTDTFTYQVADTDGQLSNLATVTVGISGGPGGQAPVAASDTATVVRGGQVRIPVLANDSDVDGDLAPASLTIVTAPVQGLAEVDVATGDVVYQHGGGPADTDSFTYRVSDQAGRLSNTATVTVQATEPDAEVNVTGPAPGALVRGPEVTVTYELSGTDFDHLHLALDGAGHNTIMDLTGSFTFTDVSPGEHTVTATLVTAGHTPVPGVAASSVTFRVSDAIGSPIALDDQSGVGWGQQSQVNVLANDEAVEGQLDVSSVYIAVPPEFGNTAIDPVTGSITYQHGGLEGTSDSFRYQVMDDRGVVSNEATVTMVVNPSSPDGTVLHLEADNGVTTTGENLVTGWWDQSGALNHLASAGDPRLVPGALNGHPVIDLDGSGDRLERIGALNALPAGGQDRTVILLANYRGGGYGGFSYGRNRCNETFGTSVNPAGDLIIQGWCGDNDFHTGIPGTGAGWLIQAAVLQSDQLRHYRNGELIDSQVHSFNTTLNRLVLGAELDSRPHVDMQVAAVMIFDRALSTDELAVLDAYLKQKYLPHIGGGVTNQPPVAGDDSATVTAGGTITIELLGNDLDPEGALDPASLEIVQPAAEGSVEVDPETGSANYSHFGAGSGDSFQYRIADAEGLWSGAATVTVTVTAMPDEAPVAAEDEATVEQGGVALITVLANDADPEGELDPTSVVITAIPAHGEVVVDPDTGEVFYEHDAGPAVADSFQYQVSDLSGNTSGQATVTLTIEPVELSLMLLSPTPGEVVRGASVTVDFSVTGFGADALELVLDERAPVQVSTGQTRYTFLSVVPGEHRVRATLVDSTGAPVVASPGTQERTFTTTDEVGAPVAFGDQAGVGWGQSVDLNVLANDLPVDGALDPSSVLITRLPDHGSVLADPETGSVTYTHNGLSGVSDSFSYQVMDDRGVLSNEAEVNLSVSGTLPSTGLVLQLEADSGITTTGLQVTAWVDQSGNGNDLVAVGDPQWVTDGVNGRPAVDFDGSGGDRMELSGTPLGLPAGSADRTVILVANYRGGGYGGFTYGRNRCNEAFGPSVDPGGNLMVQGWCGGNDFPTSVPGTGEGWLIQTALLQGNEVRHYLNDTLIDTRLHAFNTTPDRLVIGAELDARPQVDMQVVAAVIYDRALDDAELTAVLTYLSGKYGIY